MNLYSILTVELLKDTEDTILSQYILNISKTMFEAVDEKLKTATTDKEKDKLEKLKAYFAIPYSMLSTYLDEATPADFANSSDDDSAKFLADYKEKDKTADSYENTAKFLKSLNI
jgi:hypothetical protein